VTLELLANEKKRTLLSENIKKLAKPQASRSIVDEVFKLI